MKSIKNKIPMNITIETKQSTEPAMGEAASPLVRTNAFGFLKKTRHGLELEYLEEQLSVPGKTLTTVSMLEDNIVTVNHFGPLSAYMVFEEGKSHNCIYDTEPVPMQLCIKTNKLANSISAMGGRLDIDYTVLIAGTTAEHSRVSFSVSPHESILTS